MLNSQKHHHTPPFLSFSTIWITLQLTVDAWTRRLCMSTWSNIERLHRTGGHDTHITSLSNETVVNHTKMYAAVSFQWMTTARSCFLLQVETGAHRQL